MSGQTLDDPERLAALRAADLAGEIDLTSLERVSRLVARLLRVPTALVNVVDDEEQTTVTGTSALEQFGTRGVTGFDRSFCHNVVTGGAPFVVGDARDDDRVADNLAVTEDGIVAYYGVPLRTPDGYILGALCAVDQEPRTWTEEDRSAMNDLGSLITDELALRAAGREIERLARIDPLTGLGNRRWWEDRAPGEVKRAAREGTALSVVLFDLDGFKAVNDTQGHAAGDQVLRTIGERWLPLIREPDLLVRWGGDEFACLLTSAGEAAARLVAERLAAARPESVGVSFGVAEWREGEALDALVARADDELYAVKRAR